MSQPVTTLSRPMPADADLSAPDPRATDGGAPRPSPAEQGAALQDQRAAATAVQDTPDTAARRVHPDPTATADLNAADPHVTGADTDDTAPAVRPLERFLPDGPSAGTPAVTVNGSDAVVLARRDTGIHVYRDGAVLTLDARTPAVGITDPRRRENLLRRAVAEVARQRTAQRGALWRVAEEHAESLEAIRDYAIGRHLSRDICRRGMDDFLDHFDFEPYRPRVRVTYTITGSYEVEDSDTDAAYTDARGYLKADLGEIDRVVEDSDSFTVTVDDVTEVDD